MPITDNNFSLARKETNKVLSNQHHTSKSTLQRIVEVSQSVEELTKNLIQKVKENPQQDISITEYQENSHYLDKETIASLKKLAERYNGFYKMAFCQADFTSRSLKNLELATRGVCSPLVETWLGMRDPLLQNNFFNFIKTEDGAKKIAQLNIKTLITFTKNETQDEYELRYFSEDNRKLIELIKYFGENDSDIIELAKENVFIKNKESIRELVSIFNKNHKEFVEFVKIIAQDDSFINKLVNKHNIINDEKITESLVQYYSLHKSEIHDLVLEAYLTKEDIIGSAVQYCSDHNEKIVNLLKRYNRNSNPGDKKIHIKHNIIDGMYEIDEKKYCFSHINDLESKLGKNAIATLELPISDGRYYLTIRPYNEKGLHAVGMYIDIKSNTFQFFDPNFGEFLFSSINDMQKFFRTFTMHNDTYDLSDLTVQTFSPIN
ncbi:YopT-type cysteine protease domain-containing protein [Candidatus Fukatsuia endosymbiont of Tuberolachnus salignus]|uniref:YopT-type cysteine protease domain-containing protein n=1 Tax=Candidatus Fukatsuia endosymbiont of Tuberolachnus salignus TaxID=3077957 RepID=UPI00313C593B